MWEVVRSGIGTGTFKTLLQQFQNQGWILFDVEPVQSGTSGYLYAVFFRCQ